MAYRVRGIKDSEKEGWYKTNPDCPQCCTSRIEVDTPLGTIIAEVSADSDYPGIWLSFASANDLNDDGTPWERTIALLEAPSEKSVELKVWADERTNEDYTDLFPVESVIKSAKYTSVWDGDTTITTNCKVNMETREVFDIEPAEISINTLNSLDTEYVEIDGEIHPVFNAPHDTEFWYN